MSIQKMWQKVRTFMHQGIWVKPVIQPSVTLERADSDRDAYPTSFSTKKVAHEFTPLHPGGLYECHHIAEHKYPKEYLVGFGGAVVYCCGNCYGLQKYGAIREFFRDANITVASSEAVPDPNGDKHE